MKKVVGIKQFQHFRTTHLKPGAIQCKETTESKIIEVNQVTDQSWKPGRNSLPPVIEPKGLDDRRKWYLFEKIRPYC